MSYDPKRIEPRWQRYWEENATFKADVDPSRSKFYVLDIFPIPRAMACTSVTQKVTPLPT